MIRAANDEQFGRKWRRDWAYSSGIWSDLGSVFYQTVIGECLVLVFSIVFVYQTLSFCVVFTLLHFFWLFLKNGSGGCMHVKFNQS